MHWYNYVAFVAFPLMFISGLAALFTDQDGDWW